MKIVCDACDARYAIDDARLQGHGQFKVRCRRCDHLIVVRNRSSAKPRWHLVVQGDEVGPLTTSEVIAGVDTGDLHGATLVWRQGFADWRRLTEVAELREQVSRASGASTPAPAPRRAGLFDVAVAQPEQSEAGVPLTASRNESSVLFSIANLHALAESSPRQEVESGLIDICALAPGPAPTCSEDHESTLISSYATATAPLLVPGEPPRSRWLVPALAGVGAVLLTTTVVLVVVLTLGERSEAAAPAAPAPEETGLAPKHPAPAKPAAAPEAPGAREPAPAARDQEAAAKAKPKAKAKARRPRRRPRRRPIRQARRPIKKRGAGAPSTPKHTNTLTRLIDEAVNEADQSPGAPAEKGKAEDLPSTLERRQIRAGVHAVRDRVRACFHRYRVPGTAKMKLTIGPRGRLSRVAVRGRFAGTPTGACLRQAFSSARFPRFDGPPLRVDWPVFLR